MTTVVRDSKAITAMAKAMTEAQLQEAVIGMAEALGIWVWHDTDSRRNKAGMPDLVLIGRRVAFWELKAEAGRLRDAQRDVLGRLLRAGQTTRVVKPMHLLRGDVQRWLREMR